ncbi:MULTISPECIES: PqiB family protein [unclassified Vibrio]|uniref:MlaD family protein n=1 Tax=Vibrio sp. HB236076 TaxID=3232307 RepID=A0AB39HCQ4_9VIBR|nr:MlaD family protein [Vibrio sp. HB161653]MDP5253329.1 MlaD family protein [Vibrio sp. HB161653]
MSSHYSPQVRKGIPLSPLWLLPLVALGLAVWLIYQSIHDAGERIQINFTEAQGLVAGRTPVKYQGLEVGMVRSINLSNDLGSIYADVDIYPEATQLLGENTKFWLVKPTASLSGISGLDALVSGNYISIYPGEASEDFPQMFKALTQAPKDIEASQGLNISLKAEDLGGLAVGSKVYYKKIPIGEVYSYQLDEQDNSVILQASIDNKYRHLINDKSRFWNMSGISTEIGLSGINVQMQSISGLISGAIAVDSPDHGTEHEKYPVFTLFPDLRTAGRGIPIHINLPSEHGINSSGAPIMYKGIEVGEITDVTLDGNQTLASAAIQPAFTDLLSSDSQFVLEEAEVSLSGVKNLGNLLRGNYISVIPGKNNDNSRDFIALRKADYLEKQPGSRIVTLSAENTYGIENGANVLYKGIKVGQVVKLSLNKTSPARNVEIRVLINSEYTPLLKTDNRFFVTNNINAAIDDGGLSLSMPPLRQLVVGTISFTSEGKISNQTQYHLFQSELQSKLAKQEQSGFSHFTLEAKTLPSIQVGSPILYKNIAVGRVDQYQLTANGVNIDIKIDNAYRHLINDNTVFWARSGLEFNASAAGVSLKASPLQALLKGGIEFDTLPDIENKTDNAWKLYNDQQAAKDYGTNVSFIVTAQQQVSVGMDIRSQGITIGRITELTPDFQQGKTIANARIFPKFSALFTTQGTQYWLAKPEIGIQGIKNVDAIIQPYINASPSVTDKNAKQTRFALLTTQPLEGSATFTLQSANKGSLSVGTPVLYRGIQVGRVSQIQLGHLSDRIISTIEVQREYAYLIRENSVFWNASGIDISLGLSGAQIRAGTLDSVLKGGIAFSTPEESLQPQAQSGRSFLLHEHVQEAWLTWQTAIPNPN